MEDGELKVDHLRHTISVDEGKEASFQFTWSVAGARVKKACCSIKPPASTEELRERITRLGNLYVMLRLENPARASLQTATPAVFQDHLDYVLGDDVLKLEVAGQDVSSLNASRWEIVLDYEFRVRKEAHRLMNEESQELEDAYRQAREDKGLYQRWYVTATVAATAANYKRKVLHAGP